MDTVSNARFKVGDKVVVVGQQELWPHHFKIPTEGIVEEERVNHAGSLRYYVREVGPNPVAWYVEECCLQPIDAPLPTELSDSEQELAGIDAILEERGDKYGDYETRATVEWNLHKAAQDSPNFEALTPGQKTSVFMILHKLSRILAGDPNFKDSWVDMAGYAQLIVDGDALRDKE